jgi:hypothetical protein
VKKAYQQLLVLFLIVLFMVGTSSAAKSEYENEMDDTVELRVMTFNIWMGGHEG